MGIKNFKLKINLLICIFAYLLISAQSANAQHPAPKGITVIPSIMTVDLAKDAPEYDLKYINNTNSDITLVLSVQNFSEIDEGYKINFLEEKDASNYKYSLSSWISFSNKNLELTPGEEKTVKVFIDKERMTQGGHYASILARVNQPNSKEKINVNPVLSSLLFVRADTGNEVESGKISSFTPERKLSDFPQSFILRFQNSGNVFVVPHGKIEITDPRGKIVSKGIFNEGSLNALPESIRSYSVKTNPNSKLLLPGIYTARADLHFGESNQKLTQEIKFFSWGSFNFIKIGVVIFIILIGIYFIRRKRGKD